MWLGESKVLVRAAYQSVRRGRRLVVLRETEATQLLSTSSDSEAALGKDRAF